MEKLNKLSLPATIIIASIILGGFYYVSQISKQNSIEIQEEITLEDWASDPYSWQKLKCSPITKISCDRTSCEPDNPSVWVVLDRQKREFSRCDVKGCDTYKADFNSSGAFTNIQGKAPMGTMIKVLGDKKYIEIATIGLSSLVSSGSCTAI